MNLIECCYINKAFLLTVWLVCGLLSFSKATKHFCLESLTVETQAWQVQTSLLEICSWSYLTLLVLEEPLTFEERNM